MTQGCSCDKEGSREVTTEDYYHTGYFQFLLEWPWHSQDWITRIRIQPATEQTEEGTKQHHVFPVVTWSDLTT